MSSSMELLTAVRRLPSLRRPVLRPNSRISSSRRYAAVAFRRFQSNVADTKPYYVTTPIFYVNAAPHVGHMYTVVLADVLKRWQTLRGKHALLCTGTDEHGMKVQHAAALEDMDPKQFCDMTSTTFKDLVQRSDIANDFFIRTTDDDHVTAVEAFWKRLREKGYIYQSKHQGWYCVNDETFYPETMIEKKIENMTGKIHMASKETGNMVEWTEENNYHFKLTALKDKLLEFYARHPEWVLPAARMSEVVDWVENNLTDLSISRPRNRLEWGIPVPDDHSQTIYVWVDALINYITKAGFPNWTPGQEHAGGWPADVQVIGKDILRFHAVYWPALLLALDIEPPQRILSHAHWTLGRKKMSKSAGNVVNPFFAIDRWGVDVMRYYLIHDGGIERDADYENFHIVYRYKTMLQNGLGNLASRITRPKVWSISQAVDMARNGAFPSGMAAIAAVKELAADQLRDKATEMMDRFDPSHALRLITAAIMQTNRYLTNTQPWELARNPDTKDEANPVIYHAAESLRIIGILLQPFMPEKAAELLDTLGVPTQNRTWEHARVGGDFDYGKPMRDVGKGANQGLFPPLAVET